MPRASAGLEVGDAPPRAHLRQEAGLDPDDVADPGDQGLVEQRLADRDRRLVGEQPRAPRPPGRSRGRAGRGRAGAAPGRCGRGRRWSGGGSCRRSGSRPPRPFASTSQGRPRGIRPSARTNQRPFIPRWLWTTRSPEKCRSRCLPRASARSRVDPVSSAARPWIGERALGASAVSISLPTSADWKRIAIRWIVSPSGIAIAAARRRIGSVGRRPIPVALAAVLAAVDPAARRRFRGRAAAGRRAQLLRPGRRHPRRTRCCRPGHAARRFRPLLDGLPRQTCVGSGPPHDGTTSCHCWEARRHHSRGSGRSTSSTS